MIRRLLAVLALVGVLAGICVCSAAATETGAEEMTWSYVDGTLTVSCKGAMEDFPNGAPWAAYKDQITRVVLTGGVTYLGANAFHNYDAITSVDFGSALYEIGTDALRDCDGLTVLYMPASFKIFGENCLRGCENLTQIHCQGSFPSFRLNCLWDTWCTIYYPEDRPWKEKNINDLEAAFSGRIRFLASNGEDPYETTEATTVETTVETTAETTAETTVETTVETVPTTVPETTPPAVPVETAPPQTAPPESSPPTPSEETNGPNLGLVFCGVLLAMLCVLFVFMVFSGRNKGKYSAKRKRR